MAVKSSSDQSVEYLRMQLSKREVAMVRMTGCGGKVLSGRAAILAEVPWRIFQA